MNDHSAIFRYWWSKDLLNATAPIPLSPGFVVYNEAHSQSDPQRHLAWRRWLWLYNILQTLPGVLLATQTGLEANDHGAFSVSSATRPGAGGAAAAHAGAWEAVIEQAMASLSEGLQSLMHSGLPPPDEVGFELEQAGDVVAEAELAWTNRKLVLLMLTHADTTSVWKAAGWKTVVAEVGWQKILADELKNRNSQHDGQP